MLISKPRKPLESWGCVRPRCENYRGNGDSHFLRLLTADVLPRRQTMFIGPRPGRKTRNREFLWSRRRQRQITRRRQPKGGRYDRNGLEVAQEQPYQDPQPSGCTVEAEISVQGFNVETFSARAILFPDCGSYSACKSLCTRAYQVSQTTVPLRQKRGIKLPIDYSNCCYI